MDRDRGLDGPKPVCLNPAECMKNTLERLSDAIDLVVPLSRQGVEVLRALQPLTGHSTFVFPPIGATAISR